jgi:hypothetical protein
MAIINDIKYAFTNVSPIFWILRTNAFIFTFQVGSAFPHVWDADKFLEASSSLGGV